MKQSNNRNSKFVVQIKIYKALIHWHNYISKKLFFINSLKSETNNFKFSYK
jgi:hypothetical protein